MKKLLGVFFIMISVVLVCLTGMAPPPKNVMEISAESAYLVDNSTGSVIYSKNENEKKPIASMVKIMTLLLTFDNIKAGKMSLNDRVVISHNSAIQIGSEMFLDENNEYSLSDIIKGVVVISANDGAVALAEIVGGSESAFVEKMNIRAKELGMSNTLFSNPTGLPTTSEQFSTARDVSIMTRELLKNSDYYNYSKIWLEDYKHPSGRITQLANTNKLIRFYKGCDSGKTGYTDSAKYCLSASASRDGMRVVGTVMGCNDSKVRFRDMSQLLDYAFNNYKTSNHGTKGQLIDGICSVKGGVIKQFQPALADNLDAFIAKNAKVPTIEYQITEGLKAPISEGQEVGRAVLKQGDTIVGEVKLVSPVNIRKANLWDIIKDIVK